MQFLCTHQAFCLPVAVLPFPLWSLHGLLQHSELTRCRPWAGRCSRAGQPENVSQGTVRATSSNPIANPHHSHVPCPVPQGSGSSAQMPFCPQVHVLVLTVLSLSGTHCVSPTQAFVLKFLLTPVLPTSVGYLCLYSALSVYLYCLYSFVIREFMPEWECRICAL